MKSANILLTICLITSSGYALDETKISATTQSNTGSSSGVGSSSPSARIRKATDYDDDSTSTSTSTNEESTSNIESPTPSAPTTTHTENACVKSAKEKKHDPALIAIECNPAGYVLNQIPDENSVEPVAFDKMLLDCLNTATSEGCGINPAEFSLYKYSASLAVGIVRYKEKFGKFPKVYSDWVKKCAESQAYNSNDGSAAHFRLRAMEAMALATVLASENKWDGSMQAFKVAWDSIDSSIKLGGQEWNNMWRMEWLWLDMAISMKDLNASRNALGPEDDAKIRAHQEQYVGKKILFPLATILKKIPAGEIDRNAYFLCVLGTPSSERLRNALRNGNLDAASVITVERDPIYSIQIPPSQMKQAENLTVGGKVAVLGTIISKIYQTASGESFPTIRLAHLVEF